MEGHIHVEAMVDGITRTLRVSDPSSEIAHHKPFTVLVHILEGGGLRRADFLRRSSDPFVMVNLGGQT